MHRYSVESELLGDLGERANREVSSDAEYEHYLKRSRLRRDPARFPSAAWSS